MITSRTASLIGFLLFLAVLAGADWSLRRWGSRSIRQKPRPGGRVTVLFLGLFGLCALLEVSAALLWPIAPVAAVVVVLLQFPAAMGVVLGLDHVLPDKPR
jgi:hypothetical protein